jgi:glycosyltransferase involved in cell wall biosynthesis
MPIPKKKLLIISHDKIGTLMAGPGIRYHYAGQVLSKHFDVTIGFFDPTYLPDDTFDRDYNIRHIDAVYFQKGFADADYVFALWLSDAMMDYCNRHKKVVVFDIYAPVPVENLAFELFSNKKITPEKDYEYQASLTTYKKFLENGDLFVCSNPRQQDFWQGFIFGAGEVKPSTYTKRSLFDRFITAPMGIDTSIKLKKQHTVLRGKVGNIKDTDTVILWTGGIWDWFDGVSVIEAMKLLKKHKNIKLVFYGTQHPNKDIPEMAEVAQTRKKAEEYGLINKTVYFLEGWVEYHKRFDYFLESNIAIYAHKPSIEARYSHRTRVVDHILADLPTIGTRGDYLGEIIEQKELGIMVEPGNAKALADAILACSDEKNQAKFKRNIRAVRSEFDWNETLKPLADFLLSNPQKLPQFAKEKAPLEKNSLTQLKRAIPRPVKQMIKRIIQRRYT